MSAKPHPMQSDFVTLVDNHIQAEGSRAVHFCRRAGISQSHWSEISSGKKLLTLPVILKIAKALKKKPAITLQ